MIRTGSHPPTILANFSNLLVTFKLCTERLPLSPLTKESVQDENDRPILCGRRPIGGYYSTYLPDCIQSTVTFFKYTQVTFCQRFKTENFVLHKLWTALQTDPVQELLNTSLIIIVYKLPLNSARSGRSGGRLLPSVTTPMLMI